MYKILILSFLLVLTTAFSQNPNRTVGFSNNIAGAANYTSLNDALKNAASGTIIWVAAGTYLGDEIIVPAGVTVVGGFPKTATTFSERIYPGVAATQQQSILDGNYLHRVATVYGTLDGFIITNGYVYEKSDENPTEAKGGGVLIDGGTVQNCIITNNIASRNSITPTAIISRYVASIGDVYCKGLNGTNDTILKPTYTFNTSTGKMEASLPQGIPANKIAQGIVFYVDQDPAARKITIVGRRSPGVKTWSGDYTFDTPLTDITNLNSAMADMNGANNTSVVLNYVSSQIPIWNSTYQNWRTNSWNSNSAFRYVETYNMPTGTMGEWYLPAAGELVKLTDVRTQIDACAFLLGWINGYETMFPNHVYISSSENNSSQEWGFDAYSGWINLGLSKIGKTAPGYAFPVAIKTY